MSVSGEVSSPFSSMLPETGRPEMVDLFTTDEQVAVAIPNTPFTVLLQRELDWGQQAELEAAALRGIERQTLENAANNSQTIVLDISKQRILSLAMRVVRWNVRRQDPVTKEWIPVPLPQHLPDRIQVMRRLRPKWARVLIAKVEELDKENDIDEPEMPALVAPTGDPELAPKVTSNGDTVAPIEMSHSASTWDGTITR